MVTLAASTYFLTCCKSVIYSRSNLYIEPPKFVNLCNYPLIQPFETSNLICPLHKRLSDHCLKPFTTCSDGRAWSLDRDQQRKHFLDIINERVPLCSLKHHHSKDKDVLETEIKDEEKTKVKDPTKVKEPWKIKKPTEVEEPGKVKVLPRFEEPHKTKEGPKASWSDELPIDEEPLWVHTPIGGLYSYELPEDVEPPQNVEDSTKINDLQAQASSKDEVKVGEEPKIEVDVSIPLKEIEKVPSYVDSLEHLVEERMDEMELGPVSPDPSMESLTTGLLPLVDPEEQTKPYEDFNRGVSSLSDSEKLDDSIICSDNKHKAVVELQESTTNRSDGEIGQLTDEVLSKLNSNIENLEMTFDAFIKKNRDFIQHLLEGLNYEAEKNKALNKDYDKMKHENDVLRTNNEYLKMVNARQLELFKNELDKAVGENKAAYSKKINKMEIQMEKDQDKIEHYKMTVLKYKEVMDKGDEKVLQLEDDIEKLKKKETTLLKNYVKILNFLEDVKKQLNSDDHRGVRLPKSSSTTVSAKDIDPNLKDVMKSALTNGLESLNVRDLSILHDAIQNLNDRLCHQNEIHGINLPMSLTNFRMTYEEEHLDDYINRGLKDYETASNLSIYPSRHRADGYSG